MLRTLLSRPRTGMRTVLSGLLVVIASSALAQGTTIYRCNDGSGGVLYANIPCAGGVALDLPESKPDPAALERLRREQEAFERRQATRDAVSAQAAVRRDELRRREEEARRERESQAHAYTPSYPWFYAPMYQPPLPRPPLRPRPPAPYSYVPAR